MVNQSFDATIQYAHAAIRGSFLLNGGSCIALLAFLGTSEVVEICQSLECNFSNALLWFAFGALFAIFTSAISYLSQSADGAAKYGLFNALRAFACIIYLVSISFFILGIFITKASFAEIGI